MKSKEILHFCARGHNHNHTLRQSPATFNIQANLFIIYPALNLFYYCQYFEATYNAATWLRGNYPIDIWNVYGQIFNFESKKINGGGFN